MAETKDRKLKSLVRYTDVFGKYAFKFEYESDLPRYEPTSKEARLAQARADDEAWPDKAPTLRTSDLNDFERNELELDVPPDEPWNKETLRHLTAKEQTELIRKRNPDHFIPNSDKDRIRIILELQEQGKL